MNDKCKKCNNKVVYVNSNIKQCTKCKTIWERFKSNVYEGYNIFNADGWREQ